MWPIEFLKFKFGAPQKSQTLSKSLSIYTTLRVIEWPIFTSLERSLLFHSAIWDSVYAQFSPFLWRCRKRHFKIQFWSNLVTVRKMRFWDLEHTSSSSYEISDFKHLSHASISMKLCKRVFHIIPQGPFPRFLDF